MLHLKNARSALFVSTALSAALVGSAAFAQAAPAPDANALEEVVVTATRQVDTVNRVALSIAAVTQQTLDQQGLKQASDLTRTVPGLFATVSQGGAATFAIRGIVASVGAATTGVYLDDTSLTKRNNAGVSQNPGAPTPVLYDLERVEVLKGPQGTLYGGSSEGGTIRFITPAPSLTHYSGSARAEVSDYTGGGAPSWEYGAALGGPIVQDKLAFRISGIQRDTGGWVNLINPFTGAVIAKNDNENKQWAARAQLLWQINDRASATAAYYHADTWNAGGSNATTDIHAPDGSIAPAGQTWTTAAVCNTVARPAATVGAFVPPTVACPANAVPGQTVNGVYMRPAATYGPFTLGKRDALATAQLSVTPGYTKLDVGSMTLDYHFDHMNVKSVTSYVQDHGYSENAGGEDPTQQQRTTLDSAHTGFPLFSYGGDFPGHFQGNNWRYGLEQELRFSSEPSQRPFNWVAGLYFANTRIHTHYEYRNPQSNADRTQLLFRGIDALTRYGVVNDCNCQARLDARIQDTELAGFGEGNYWITDKLKATVGLRVTRNEIQYFQLNYGQFSSRIPTSVGAVTSGQGVDNPVTPKFSVEYDLKPNQIVYATAAKGFRAGGVNPNVSQAVCQTGLDQLGINATQIPSAYNSDTVWSYELGGKFRLFDNKLQLNGALYQIDWTGVQSTVTIGGCGQSFVVNGGRAQSRGVDLQANFRPIGPLTLTLNAGYDEAKYLDPVKGPAAPGSSALPTFLAGDPLGVPTWQISADAEYQFKLMDKYDMYVRGDDQWQGAYTQGASYGVSQYNPYTRRVPAVNTLNARLGARLNAWDFNVFALNVLDSRTAVVGAGGAPAGNGIGACNAPSAAVPGGASCSAYVTWTPFVQQAYQRPRVVGVQANYKF
jgi:iron complex outermembrane receptor protein